MILTHHGIDSLRRAVPPYTGPFVLLNNFESISNEISKSEIGPDFNTPTESFSINNSNVFLGKNCLLKNNANRGANTTDNITLENTFTCETYFSNFNSLLTTQVCEVRFGEIFCELWGYNQQFRIQATTSTHTQYNGASFYGTVAGWNYYIIPISIITPCHLAIVVVNNDAYIFFNGTLYLKLHKDSNFMNTFKPLFANETSGSVRVGLNFYAARNGDFSNNLQSFDVPTSKYHL